MPERIPRHKRVRILQLYLSGASEVEVAAKLSLAQATVSNEVKRFIDDAGVSLEDACRRYGVSDVLKGLHQFSVQLEKKGLKIADLVAIMSVYDALESLGKTIDDLADLVPAVKRMGTEPELADAAVRLLKLERQWGRNFQEVLADLEAKKAQLEKLVQEEQQQQGRMNEMQERQAGMAVEIRQAEQKLAAVNAELNEAVTNSERLKGLGLEKVESLARFIEEYESLRFDANVVKELADLKRELAAEGIAPGAAREYLREKGALRGQIAQLNHRKKKIEKEVARIKTQWDMWFQGWRDTWENNERFLRLKSVLQGGWSPIECKNCGKLMRFPILSPEKYKDGMWIQCQHCRNFNYFNYYEIMQAIALTTLQAMATMPATSGPLASPMCELLGARAQGNDGEPADQLPAG